ncbi:uncharacterized protein LOC120011522 isoform X2 [Tripterygium wilfordii]|uniref:uncharacterized protein LOC120011522 isoform X2 n=1 Tax=Tripterygium wilfordii TaxID=458696 RepID=UPI0018F85450|nr:uncharacterized protein LOC120011522 isoform X2 [Tripterygium wilfordii]
MSVALSLGTSWWLVGKEKMRWNYPEISLEDMIKLVNGFDSGIWVSIKKALQWGSFFENESSVLHQLLCKTEEKSYTIRLLQLFEAMAHPKLSSSSLLTLHH